MKTLKISEETHQRLTEIKAKTRSKTLDETINILANTWCYSIMKKEYKFDDK